MSERPQVMTQESGAIPAGSDNAWSVDFADSKAAVSGSNRSGRKGRATVTRLCRVCNTAFTAQVRHLKRPNRGWTCSRQCAGSLGARITHATHPQQGAGNFRFKGWASKRPSVYVRRLQAANPEKVAAGRAVAVAIKRGILTRPSFCASCGRDGRVDAHHPDYTKQLSVEWLCRKCNAAADKVRAQQEIAARSARKAV